MRSFRSWSNPDINADCGRQRKIKFPNYFVVFFGFHVYSQNPYYYECKKKQTVSGEAFDGHGRTAAGLRISGNLLY